MSGRISNRDEAIAPLQCSYRFQNTKYVIDPSVGTGISSLEYSQNEILNSRSVRQNSQNNKTTPPENSCQPRTNINNDIKTSSRPSHSTPLGVHVVGQNPGSSPCTLPGPTTINANRAKPVNNQSPDEPFCLRKHYRIIPAKARLPPGAAAPAGPTNQRGRPRLKPRPESDTSEGEGVDGAAAGGKAHSCQDCDSSFMTNGELTRHMRYKHTHEKPHKCTECKYATVEQNKLVRHMRSHTGERPFQCQQCAYASPDAFKLKRHSRVHTGEKPYECELCKAKFTQSNSLKLHKMTHSAEKPTFNCEQCPATYGRKNDLRTHVAKFHTTTKEPLKCKKCTKLQFPDRYTLKLHKKTHEGTKTFKCSMCNFEALTQRHLESHKRTHADQVLEPCDECDQAFIDSDVLRQHKHLFHPAAVLQQSHLPQLLPQPPSNSVSQPPQPPPSDTVAQLPISVPQPPISVPQPASLIQHPTVSVPQPPNLVPQPPISMLQPSLTVPQQTSISLPQSLNMPQVCMPQPMPAHAHQPQMAHMGATQHLHPHHMAHHQHPNQATPLQMSMVARDKPHACPVCGKMFRHKGNLIRHLAIHDPSATPDQVSAISNELMQGEEDVSGQQNLHHTHHNYHHDPKMFATTGGIGGTQLMQLGMGGRHLMELGMVDYTMGNNSFHGGQMGEDPRNFVKL